jgi:hypothetical protein
MARPDGSNREVILVPGATASSAVVAADVANLATVRSIHYDMGAG